MLDVSHELKVLAAVREKDLNIVEVVILCQVLMKLIVLDVSTRVLLRVETRALGYVVSTRLNGIMCFERQLGEEKGCE